jgi:hypothetical protein
MKLKQTSPHLAPNYPRYIEIGQAFPLYGPDLIILAEQKGWEKKYGRDYQHQIQQQYCEA